MQTSKNLQTNLENNLSEARHTLSHLLRILACFSLESLNLDMYFAVTGFLLNQLPWVFNLTTSRYKIETRDQLESHDQQNTARE